MSGQDVKPGLVPLWPHAGKRLGYGSRTATYAAEARGIIKVVRLGKLKRVPVAWLERKVAGEEEAA